MLAMPAAKSKNAPIKEARGFEDAARGVMREVQESFSRLIAAVPGRSKISKAADLQKALGVDPKLGWRVFRVANASNPLAAGPELPSRVSMEKLFKAAAKLRMSSQVIERAADAFERFEQLVADHAGDRESFASMVSALSPAGAASEEIDLTHRRVVFRGNSHIWGVQTRCQLSFGAIAPSPTDSERGDIMVIRGLIDLRRLRADVPVVIARSQVSSNEGSVYPYAREPIDPDATTVNGQTVLREFCSKPLPNLQSLAANTGGVTIEIPPDAVGNQSLLTCITGDILRGSQRRHGDPGNETDTVRAVIHTPCELVINDLLIHDDMYAPPVSLKAGVYSNLLGRLGMAGRDFDRLPLRVSVERLGRGLAVLDCPDVPRYSEMAQYAFDQLGWDAGKFQVYRCRMEYPVMQSFVDIRFELPEPPTPPAKPHK